MKPYGQVFLNANKKFFITCTRCEREINDYDEFQNHVLVVHLDPLCTEKNENASRNNFKEKLPDESCLHTENPKKYLKAENIEEQGCELGNWIDTVFPTDVNKGLKKEENTDEDTLIDSENVSRFEFEDVNYAITEPLIEIKNHLKTDEEDISADETTETNICKNCDKAFSIGVLEKHKARKKCGPCPVCSHKYTDLYKHLKTNHEEYCEEKRRLRKAIIPGKSDSTMNPEQKNPNVEDVTTEDAILMETDEIDNDNESDDNSEDDEDKDEETSGGKEKIVCNYCGKSFSYKTFESHKARRKCGKCPVCFKVVPDVYAHVPNFHKEYSEEKRRSGEYVVKRLPIIGEKTFDKPDKILTCTYCEKVFKTELFYKQHVLKHEQFLNTCKECGMSFQYSSGLKKHLRKHTDDRPFKCKICSASFNNEGSLKTHISNKHTIGQKVKCTFENCGKIFKNKERKRYHELYAHYNECKHLCVDCGLRFKTSGALNKHAKTVHLSYEDREFQCKFCNLKFAFKYELDPHEMMHLGQKRYLCEFCTKGYGKKSHLRRHCQSIHGRDID